MEGLDQNYTGLVFDLDGTLADTMPTHFIAWSRTLRAHGLYFPEDRFYALGGVPAPVIVDRLAREQGKAADAEAIAEEKETLFLELLGEVRPVAPVRAIADAYRGRLPMGVATGSLTWVAEKILRGMEIRDWFQAVVGADQVENPKPAPDVYQRAARKIGAAPEKCHAFEDTELGMESARNAGMAVVNIHTLG